ncbi:glycosyltransferase family 87 protein [Streptacidiphilus anmyonensis]|uniref:glycosyltransferase family 87 protein n=1 Tax=Streptacidiphilus anmyonensis TaxID=405782 RepID=UPI000693FBD7|nr:glycosyltransferase 87 family protein [Streptacidiphilus anmyonensis]
MTSSDQQAGDADRGDEPAPRLWADPEEDDADDQDGAHGAGDASAPRPALPVPPPEDTVVVPADEDPVSAAASELIGGAPGRHALLGVSWWTAARVLAVITVVVWALGMVQKVPCYDSGWFYGASAQYDHACYSDIPHLFTLRGFNLPGNIPYVDKIPGSTDPTMQYLEYPVLTGLFVWGAAQLTPTGGGDVYREQIFYLVNAGMLLICAVVAVVAVSRTHRRRPWDALLFALAPVLALDGTINWDMLAVALAAVGMALWARRYPVWAGVLIGLATAAKLYPVFLLGPLLVLCLRAGRMREFGQALAGAAVAWLLVDIPFMIANFSGWATFYTFSESRGVDFGSFWLILTQNGWLNASTNTINTIIAVLLVVCFLGIGWLALAARRRPRFAQLAFLVVAAFTLTNKVYSPQYVLWLLPLAVLARPRWRDFLIWQACEVLYFLGVWYYLAYSASPNQRGLPPDWYHASIALHILGTLYLVVVIVRDALSPAGDPVRADGSDDPSGGVLDGAADVFTLTGVKVQAAPTDTTRPSGATSYAVGSAHLDR